MKRLASLLRGSHIKCYTIPRNLTLVTPNLRRGVGCAPSSPDTDLVAIFKGGAGQCEAARGRRGKVLQIPYPQDSMSQGLTDRFLRDSRFRLPVQVFLRVQGRIYMTARPRTSNPKVAVHLQYLADFARSMEQHVEGPRLGLPPLLLPRRHLSRRVGLVIWLLQSTGLLRNHTPSVTSWSMDIGCISLVKVLQVISR